VWVCSGECAKKNETCVTKLDLLMNVSCKCERKKNSSLEVDDEDPILTEMDDMFGTLG
jgi:hypothetical protein